MKTNRYTDTVPGLMSIALLLCLVAGDLAAQPAQSMHSVPGWYLGMPVLLTTRKPAEGVDRTQLPNMPVYITAPISASAGTSPRRTVSLPRGEVVLPPHQDTLVTMPPDDDPVLAVGYFVEVGPAGSEDTVQSQEQPENAWPSRPLASAIRIGTEWVKLNNHIVIEYGLKMGLLQLEFFDVGGLMSARHFSGDSGPGVRIAQCAYAQPPQLPEIKWAEDPEHFPGEK